MPATTPSPPRSVFVTALAWTILVTGALLTPISLISFLMILAKSDGTQSTTAIGFLSVVVAPSAAVVVGIGLLRRRAWAWWGVLPLLVAIIAANAHTLATARSTDTTYTSPSGVKTTVLASPPNQHSLPLIALCTLLLLKLCSRSVRDELSVDYSGDGGGGVAAAVPPRPVVRREPPKQRAAVALVVCILGGLAGGMAWMVKTSIEDGTTTLPMTRSWQRRAVSRAEEPATFWLSVGVYAGVGIGSAGLLLWGASRAQRLDG